MLLGSEVMQIKVKDFIEKIENQSYRHETILADKEEDVLQNVDQAVAPLIDKMVDAIGKEELAETELVIGDGADDDQHNQCDHRPCEV